MSAQLSLRAVMGFVVALGFSTVSQGFIQDRTPDGSQKVHWNLAAAGQPNISAGRVVYAVNRRGSDDVAFATATAAVDAAFGSWRRANSSAIDFLAVADPAPTTLPEGTGPNRTDQVDVVFWDEDPRNISLIPSFTFSATIVRADGVSGEIFDADIVLNGFQFLWANRSDSNFTTRTGPVDIQSALTQAVGLFIGLINVPTQGSVMQERDYEGDISLRVLTSDDLAGVLDAYPPIPDPGVTSVSGRVTKSGQGVFGAYVAAIQNGRPVVGGITDTSGNYSIRRLAPGTYSIRVMTVKQPPALIRPFFSGLDNNFLSEVYQNLATDPGTSVVAVAGTDVPGVNIDVSTADMLDPWEPDNTLSSASVVPADGSRRVHHTFPAGDADWVKFAASAGHVYLIETSNLGLGGTESDTLLTLTGPTGNVLQTNDDRNPKQRSRISRIVFQAATTGDLFVQAVQTVAAAAGSGTAYDISVSDLGASIPIPVVSAATPPEGSQGGGYQVTITGSNFVPGATVTFGGMPGTEVDVVITTNPTKLFVTVPAAASPGAVNVTVTNPGGVASAPLVGGFTYLEDVTLAVSDDTFFALGTFPGESRAVAWVDYDKDGDLDLYFTNGPLGSLVVSNLYRNNGDGTFTDVTAESGISAPGARNFVSATWGDYNNDGCQDVYLVNLIVSAERFLLRNRCDGSFLDVTSSAGVAGRSNGRSRDAAWADFDQDGFLDLFVAYDDLAGPNQLFRNNHNGQFTDVAAAAGLANVGAGFNANWGDFNNDGLPDLFLVRSGAQADILYKNNGNGIFVDVTAAVGIIDTAQGTDAVWGNFNNDEYLDLYVVGATGINHLFQNTGGTNFTDVSTPPTLANAGNSFGAAQGAAVGDMDLDGDLDLVVVQSLLTGGSREDLFFQNNGGSPPTFSAFTFPTQFGDPYDAYAAAFGDYSGDGAPDLVVGNVGSSSDVLWLTFSNRNDALVVLLVGTKSNRLGIGARVSVTADLDGNPGTAPVTQTREMIGGSKGQNPIEIHFGLGRTAVENRKVDNLTVVWPRSGIVQPFPNLAVNQVVTVIEGTQGVLISAVAPSSGTTAGGTPVVVSGLNFDSDAEVRFGGVLAPTVTDRTGSTSISVTTPPHGTGPVNVTVTNISRAVGDPLREGSLVNGFVYFSDVQQSLFVFDGVNTTLVWGENPGQVTYDAIRGNLGVFQEGGGQVNLGPVICLENDSTDNTTAPNHLDQAMPAGGQGFFYLVRFGGSYGTSSAGSVEVPASGGCP